MEVSAEASDIALGENVVLRSGAPPLGDLVFLPTSSDSTPGELNSAVLQQLGLGLSVLPPPGGLKRGYALHRDNERQICFVVTVGTGSTAKNLQTNLTKALKDPALISVTSMWVPMMGTGAGKLAFAKSLTVTLNALRATGWIAKPAVQIVLSLPPDVTLETDPGLGKAITSLLRGLETDPDSQSPDSDGTSMPPLDYSEPVSALLALAAALKSKRRQPGGHLSTTLLLFALAEARSGHGAKALSGDRSAAMISAAIRDRAGARYAEAWARYFLGHRRVDPIKKVVLPKLTTNLQTVLKRAETRARLDGRTVITIDDLVEEFLSYEKGNFNDSLRFVGVTGADLLDDYHDMRAGQILMSFHNDVATVTDKLGYDSYAKAISRFLIDAETPPPLSISIQAPWGAGKSSLMQLIREELDPKVAREKHRPKVGQILTGMNVENVLVFLNRSSGSTWRTLLGRTTEAEKPQTIPLATIPLKEPSQRVTIWFNVWKYETSEQIWAGLVDAIVSQISERLSTAERELFLLRLQLSRVDDGVVRRKIYDRIIATWWARIRRWLLVGGSAILGMVGLSKAAPALLVPAGLQGIADAFHAFGLTGALIGQILLSAYLAREYFLTSAKTKAEPATFSLAEYIRVPDYDKSVGEIHQIHADLRRVLSVTPVQGADGAHDPIVIFIDDLDRCSPSKIANVVEGVSMLLASDTYRCMFVIGMDPQMVAAALEKAHEDVREQLPSYERSVPLGWRFMDKFVQLPFTIPPSRRDRLDQYLESLGGAPRPRPVVPTPAPRPTPLAGGNAALAPPAISEEALPVPATPPAPTPEGAQGATPREARDVGKIIRLVASDTAGNPREVKRMVNLARFYLSLRNARRSVDSSWRSPNLEEYARWIALTLRWPDMMRWLQWGADEAAWSAEDIDQELIVRRLRKLEATAEIARSPREWSVLLGLNLCLSDAERIDWTFDPKLLEFFKRETGFGPDDRLSAAAAREFW